MKCFLDTNIIIYLLADRKPFMNQAKSFLASAIENEIDLVTSSHAIATCYYILRKYIGENELRQALLDVMKLVDIIPIDKSILERGLTSRFSDVEDAIQYYASSLANEEVLLITRDKTGFIEAKCLVMNPREAVRYLETN